MVVLGGPDRHGHRRGGGGAGVVLGPGRAGDRNGRDHEGRRDEGGEAARAEGARHGGGPSVVGRRRRQGTEPAAAARVRRPKDDDRGRVDADPGPVAPARRPGGRHLGPQRRHLALAPVHLELERGARPLEHRRPHLDGQRTLGVDQHARRAHQDGPPSPSGAATGTGPQGEAAMPPRTAASDDVGRGRAARAHAPVGGALPHLGRRTPPGAARPPSITAMRSASAKASAWSWVTATTVRRGVGEEAAEVPDEPLAQRAVERAERLVEQQHRRLGGQGPGQRDALLLAARELGDGTALRARAGRRASSSSATRRCDGRPTRALHAQAEGDVAGRRRGAGTGRGPGT